MANAITYIKNVGKSIGYASVKVFEDKNPVFHDFKETNGDLMRDMYHSVRDLKKNAKRVPNKVMESPIGEFAVEFKKNLFEDIKSGNFYNKERAEKADEDIMTDFLGDDVDMSVFEDFGDLDESTFGDEETSSNDMMDIVGEKSSQAVSNAVARSSEYIVEAQSQMHKASYRQMNQLYGGIHLGMSTVNQNISKILEFANENLNTHIENSKTFYSEITKMDQERNQYLKDIADTLKEMNNPTPKESANSTKYSDIVSMEGVIDFSRYGKQILKNIDESTGGLSDMIKMMFDMGALKQIAGNPLEYVMTGFVESLIPKMLDESMEKFNTVLSGIVGNLLTNLKIKANDTDDGGGIWSIINNIFGINTELKTSIDPSKYEKGKVPFDGKTRKSITEVIPTYLSKIYSALTGAKRDTYDYDAGKFVSIESLNNQIDTITKNSANAASRNINNVVSEKLKDYKFKDSEQEKQFKESWESIRQYMFNNQISLDTRNSKLKGVDFGLTSDADWVIKLLQQFLDNTPENFEYSNRMYREIASQNKFLESIQSDGTILAQARDNSDNNESIPEGGVISKIGSGVNETLMNKLNEIHKELTYIRKYGLPGNESNTSPNMRLDTRPSFEANNQPIQFRNELGEIVDPLTMEPIKSEKKEDKSDDSEGEPQEQEEKEEEVDGLEKARREAEEQEKKRKTIGDRIKGLKKFSLGIVQGPMEYAASILDKIDLRLYELMFGKPDKADEDDDRSFKEILFDKAEETFNSFKDWMQENIFDPLSENSLSENIHNAAEKFLKIFKIDLDESIEKVKNFFTGIDEDGVEHGFFGKFAKDFKDTFKSVKNWFTESADDVNQYAGNSSFKEQKEERQNNNTISRTINTITNEMNNNLNPNKNKNDRTSSDYNPDANTGNIVTNVINAVSNNENNEEEPAENHANGIERVKKTGLAFLSEGEMVVPSSGNPNKIKEDEKRENNVRENLKSELDKIKGFATGTNNATVDPDGNAQGENKKGKPENKVKRVLHVASNASAKLKKVKSVDFSNVNKKKNEKGETVDYIDQKLFDSAPEQIKDLILKIRLNQFKSEEDKQNAVNIVNEYFKGQKKTDAKDNSAWGKVKSTGAEWLGNAYESIKTSISKSLGLDEDDEEKKKSAENFKEKSLEIIEESGNNSGSMAAGALIGGGVSLLTGLVGGPLLGAAVGAGTALITRSEKVQNLLFGKKDDESGEREGGVIPKKFTDMITKYIPSMAKGGALGGVTAMLPFVPGGPVAGIIVGSALGFATKNETVQNAIFGEGKLFETKEDFQKKLQSVLPKMGAGALAGLIAGPFGPAANIILGSTLGFASDTNKFKDFMFGEEIDGKRQGGFFNDKILKPITDAIQPIGKQLQIMGEHITDFIKGFFKDKVFSPIEKLVKDIGKKVWGFFSPLLKPVTAIIKHIVTLPSRTIGRIGDAARAHQIKIGRADYMTAEARNAFREQHGIKGDKMEAFDKGLAETEMSKLDSARKALQGIADSNENIDNVKSDAISQINKALKASSLEHSETKEIAKMINSGQFNNAIDYANKLKFKDDDEKKNFLEQLTGADTRLKNHKDMQQDIAGKQRELAIKALERLGIENPSEEEIGEILNNKQGLQNRIKLIENEYAFKEKQSKTDDGTDKPSKFEEAIIDTGNDIEDILKQILGAITKQGNPETGEKEERAGGLSDEESETNQERIKSYQKEFDDAINPAEGEEPKELKKETTLDSWKYRMEHSKHKALTAARIAGETLVGKPVGAAMKGIKVVNKLGVKGGKFIANEALSAYDAVRDSDWGKRVFGNRRVDYHNPGEEVDIETHQSKIKQAIQPDLDIGKSRGLLNKIDYDSLDETDKRKYDIANRVLGKYSDKHNKGDDSSNDNIKRVTAIISAMAAKQGIDTAGIDVKESSKSLLSKVNNKFKNSPVYQFVNGRVLKFIRDKNGDLINDTSNAENKETMDAIEEEENNKRGILSTIKGIGGKIGGIFDKIFGKKEEKESIFSKIWKFITGDGKGGFSLVGLLKDALSMAIPVGLTAFGLKGAFDKLFNKLSGGAFGKEKQDKITVTDENGNEVAVQVDENGNPIKDADGNYITENGDALSSEDTYLHKNESVAEKSFSERLGYNFVRGAITGKGSVISSALGLGKMAKSVGKKVAGSSFGKNAAIVTDMLKQTGKDPNMVNAVAAALRMKLKKWAVGLLNVPYIGKHLDEKRINELVDKFIKMAKPHMPNTGKALNALNTALHSVNYVFKAIDFTTGFQDTSTILKINPEDATLGQQVVCGLIRTLKNSIPILGTLIPEQVITDFFIKYVSKWFRIDVSELEENRAKAQAELDEYNATHEGEDLSWEQYNKQVKGNYTWTEKISNAARSFKTNIKDKGLGGTLKSIGATAVDKVKNTKVGKAVIGAVDKVIDFTKPILDAINEKVAPFIELGKYGFNAAIDTFKETLTGKEYNSDKLAIAEDDPLGSYKKIMYNVIKIIDFFVGSPIRTARQIWDTLKTIGSSLLTIGKGVGTTASNMMQNAWKGNLVEVFTDTSGNANSDIAGLNYISSVVNGTTKFVLAIPALMTAEIGAIARNFKSILEGIKTVGSGVVNTATSMLSKAWSGDKSLAEIFTTDTNAETGNMLIDSTSAVLNGITKTLITPTTLLTTVLGKIKNKLSPVFDSIKTAGTLSEEDNAILDKSNNGDVSPFSSEYWDYHGNLNGIAGGFNWFITMVKKVFNLPSAIIASINPLELARKGTDWIREKLGYDDSETKPKEKPAKEGKGSGLYGRGSGNGSFISQVDSRYKDKPFNTSNDSQSQTIGDSGCAPATAAMAINSTYNSSKVSMQKASNLALNYKVKNDGVDAAYFQDEFARNGLDTKYITNPNTNARSQEITSQLMSNNKVVLMGKDSANRSKSSSPYGPNPHYVLATGMSSNGKYIYINDPESNKPNRKYSANKILGSSNLGIAAMGSKITNKIKRYVGRGSYGPETPQYKIWNALRAEGYGEIAAAAAMGNIQCESGFRSEAVEGGSGAGFGLIQWTGDRRVAIENAAKSSGVDASNLNFQIDYLINDLKANSGAWTGSSSKYGFGSLKRADWAEGTDLVKATQAFMGCYERPNYDPSVNHIDQRIAAANEFLQAFTGMSVDLSAYTPGDYSSSGYGDEASSGPQKTGNLVTDALALFGNLASAFGLTSKSDTSSSYGSNGSNNGSNDGSYTTASGNVSSNPQFAEQQRQLVEKMYSVKGQLDYSQSRRNPDEGSGDCSSTVQWAYKNILGVDPGANTTAQRNDPDTYTVATDTSDESQLQLGDLLLKSGHVEMYAGNNTMIGHGGGKGPKVKKLDQSGKYNLVRRWVGFKGSGSGLLDDMAGKGSEPAYSNALSYVKQEEPGTLLPFKVDENKIQNTPKPAKLQSSNKFVGSGSEQEIGSMPAPAPVTKQSIVNSINTTNSNNMVELVKAIVKLLTQVVTNTDQLNNIASLLGKYLSATETSVTEGTTQSRDNAIVAKQNLLNAMQNAGTSSTSSANTNQLIKLIEDSERIARQ